MMLLILHSLYLALPDRTIHHNNIDILVKENGRDFRIIF